MGSKPRKSRTDPEKQNADLKEVAGEFAGQLIWCLKFVKFPTGLMMTSDMKTGEPIEERIFASLDKIGYVVDRDEYYTNRDKRKRKR